MSFLLQSRIKPIAGRTSSILKIAQRLYFLPNSSQEMYKNDADITNQTELVDLRSDTLTLPSIQMKEVMINCKDSDIFHENETVKELENKMTNMTGKEASLFVFSGTMGNLISTLSHCSKRGSEIIVGHNAHIFSYEQANIAQFGGVQSLTLPTLQDGTFDSTQLRRSIKDESDFHNASTALICLENTHGGRGGKILPQSWVEEVYKLSLEHNVPLHLDGARLFNASVASGVSIRDMLAPFESASICFSKGLGCPVGSVIVGKAEFINGALRLRETLGGVGKRAGILASACLYALEHNVERLQQDHDNAKLLAAGINECGAEIGRVIEDDVHTNIVLFRVDTSVVSLQDFCDRMLQIGEGEKEELGREIVVRAYPYDESSIRFVTHMDVPRQKIEASVEKIQFILRRLAQRKDTFRNQRS